MRPRTFLVVLGLPILTLAAAGCAKTGSPIASPTPAPAATVTTTVTATTTPSPSPAVTASTPTPSPSATGTRTSTADAATSGRQFGYVRGFASPEGVKQLVWSRAQLLTGEAARAAKKANGVDPDDPPDYWIVNDPTKQRLYPLAKGYTVVGRSFFGKPPSGAPVSHARFEAAFPSEEPPPMYIYFDDAGQVTKVVEVYQP